jgi:hypothetical protein
MTEALNQPTPAATPPAMGEKDRLDYQLKLDKERMAIQYGNKWKELVWDKLFFSAFLALFGAIGFWLANRNLESIRSEEARKLEEFRTREAGTRSLLEKQMPELTAINSAISEVTRVYFDYATGRRETDDEPKVKDEYKKALDNAREVINRSMFLFDLDFNKDLDRYHAVHSLIRQLPVKEWRKYLEFARDLSNKFDDL